MYLHTYNSLRRKKVTTKNIITDKLNEVVSRKNNTGCIIYKSTDTLINADEAIHYQIEYLNSPNPSGLSPHELKLVESWYAKNAASES